MSKRNERKTHLFDAEFQPPEKKIISDGNILIKKLHEKQVNTTISLSEQLANKKEFTKSADFVSVANYGQGRETSEHLQLLEKRSEETVYLRSLGISHYDISLYLEYKSDGIDKLKAKHKFLSPEKLMHIIERVKYCMKEKETQNDLDMLKNTREINRHERESLTIKPNSLETKLLKFALQNEYSSKINMQHPMNEIIGIEKVFMEDIQNLNSLPPLHKIQKKTRNLANKVKRIQEQPLLQCPKNVIPNNKVMVKSSKWDMKEKIEHPHIIHKVNKTYTCEPQNYYSIIDGKIVRLNHEHNITEHPEENKLQQKRLTVEEIKGLQKFQNYEAGDTSKVLYLKNLANTITDDDLKSLFSDFSACITSVKLMGGKMRGQAFIEFLNESYAEAALKGVNGTVLKTKPVIIQFGKGAKKAHVPSNG